MTFFFVHHSIVCHCWSVGLCLKEATANPCVFVGVSVYSHPKEIQKENTLHDGSAELSCCYLRHSFDFTLRFFINLQLWAEKRPLPTPEFIWGQQGKIYAVPVELEVLNDAAYYNLFQMFA